MATNPEEIRQPLTEHLDELRRRLIRSLIAFGIGTALCYNFSEGIYRALLRPLTAALPGDSHLIFTELTEAFLTYFKLALWGGFVLASPVIFYQTWRFVGPGLYRKERRLVAVFAAWSTVGLLAGMAFAYFVAIPAVLTPPDAVSQILVAFPIYALFEVGILLCALGARRWEAASRAPAAQPPG